MFFSSSGRDVIVIVCGQMPAECAQSHSLAIKMPEKDDSPLCCCEYVNREGERSHILATFCNCEDLDESFDRLLTRRNVDTRRCEKIMETAVDRLRIPWWGGAKKVPPDVACGLVLVPFFILLGCISWTFIFITYLIILPTVMFSIHRFLRRKVVHKDTSTYQSGDSKDIKKYPRAKFYLTWLASSIVALLLIYYTQVIAYLKISLYENLAFMVFVWLSGTCLYLVRATACAGFDPPEKRGDDVYDDVIESGAWRICGECEQQVPRLASHCRTCGICYFMRDHHCVWSSLTTSGACYALLLGILVALALLQQLVCVVAGVKLREYKQRRLLPGQPGFSISSGFKNCLNFWWR
ncbi:palmitoyltransferase ZDHHC23 isoform X2 [Penaeus vannamei]|uniref:palmitoyltransferase ZDHHC23 isoform X2 n=1 Tax=Penaeus vannamei TaxID=6689 RepID=UPI00387F88B6